MSSAEPQARVGVGVFLVKPDGRILIGQRKGSHGPGTYAVPGGHLEFGESFEDCAQREVLEETGIQLDKAATRFAYAVNSVFDEKRHYVTIFMRCDVPQDTEAQLLEPDKCAGWQWVAYGADTIPKPHFMPLEVLLASDFRL